MEKRWLNHYPPEVPAEIDGARSTSLVQFLEASFHQFAERPAFECLGQSLTYGELDARSRQVAAWLQARGLGRGAAVALMMPNTLAYPVWVAALLRAGCTVVNVNPLFTPRELEYQLQDSGAVALVILEAFVPTFQKVQGRTAVRHVVTVSAGAPGSASVLPEAIPFERVLAEGQSLSFTPVPVSPEDVAFLQYTGGTTGVVKGAMLLHRNLLASLAQTEAWLRPALRKRPDQPLTFVCVLPLYHIYALNNCALLGMRLGALNILLPNPRDLAGIIQTLAGRPLHVLPAVNTFFNALLHHPELGRLDLSQLLIANTGGEAAQRAVAEKWFALTGVPLIESYGLTETSPGVASNPVTAPEFSGGIGMPLPSTEVALRDDEGRDVALHEPGEICIRGPQVMAGYWNRPEETVRVMTADGFLKSGDIGVMDERGFLRIVDRKKDMILVSGFNVYPNEVEGVVAAHPGVLEVAAVGVPDERSGEAVKLFVVKKDAALTEEQLQAFCREQLTGYKRPKLIEFRAELPKSNVGKILRRELRAPAG
ncbi:AMP-binding protein [Archangium primigenium]|uniref:AMP-binding protein n=1 Tax=[Archangium] primigenium TaxID=2792470 RepID=UPI0019598AFD|nr:AMP-binding protein [Archangium primigenium]